MHSTSGTEEALFYLFLAAAFGSFLGNLKFRGNSLGVATVLFVGLAIGATKPEVKIPDVIKLLGLAIFVYSIGLSSGQAFFRSIKSRGTINMMLAVLSLSILSVCVGLCAIFFGFDSSGAAGLLAGITTNTPALAGLLDAIQARGGPNAEAMSNSAVVGYSISYPMGILGLMIAVALMRRLLRVDYAAETKALGNEFPSGQPIVNHTVQVTQASVVGITLREFKKQYNSHVIFGRLRRDKQNSLCHHDLILQENDLVSITGEVPEVERIGQLLGDSVAAELSDDHSAFAMRRIVVSNPKVAGKTVASLNLSEQYPVVLTRLRRGDIDTLIAPGTVLELGDRIRVLAREEDLKDFEKVFGDSYEQLSNIDLLSFGLGMGLGIMLGSVEMTLPGGILFSLGFAGGPLVAGLLLSYLRRSGPILWTLPYSANLTLRQIGLMLMLAAIGINSGATFLHTMLSPVGPLMLMSGAIVSVMAGIIILAVGYKIFKIPFVLLSGMISHHPANLDFANNLAQNKIPTYGYALVYPMLLIGKIVFVQMLWQFLPLLGN
jgi:putative transport protein